MLHGVHLLPKQIFFIPYEGAVGEANIAVEHLSHARDGEIRYFVGSAVDVEGGGATILGCGSSDIHEAQVVVGIVHHPHIGALGAFFNDISLIGYHLRQGGFASLCANVGDFFGVATALGGIGIPHHAFG